MATPDREQTKVDALSRCGNFALSIDAAIHQHLAVCKSRSSELGSVHLSVVTVNERDSSDLGSDPGSVLLIEVTVNELRV